jgi:predicted homoserine dehydrogenase-like protein
MLDGGIVDYSLGAEPRTGGFAIVHETNPLKSAQLTYYRMGDGPFHVFFTPFHLPHLQIASTIGRAALFGDPTVTPLDGPRCEVLAVAKRDLRAGESVDAIGGFCTYGLIDNATTARGMNALPIGLAEGCTLLRDIAKDAVLTMTDVRMPVERISDRLWREQQQRWPAGPETRGRPALERDLVAR